MYQLVLVFKYVNKPVLLHRDDVMFFPELANTQYSNKYCMIYSRYHSKGNMNED